MNRRRSSAYRVSIMGILTALLILQTFVPMLGYIRITGTVAITTMHITVIIGAVILGIGYGAALGLVWGLSSLIVAFTSPSDPLSLLLFRNPVIAIVPRVMAGIVAGMIFHKLLPKFGSGIGETFKLVLAGISGAFTNTLLVIGFTWIFYASSAAKLVGNGANSGNLGIVMILLLGVNASFEAVAAGVITPLLGKALKRFHR